MRYIVNNNLLNFTAWGLAVNTIVDLKLHCSESELMLIEMSMIQRLGEPTTEEAINDFLLYETDIIASWLGYDTWESFIQDRLRKWN